MSDEMADQLLKAARAMLEATHPYNQALNDKARKAYDALRHAVYGADDES